MSIWLIIRSLKFTEFKLCPACPRQADTAFLRCHCEAGTMKKIVVVVKDIDASYLQAAAFRRLLGTHGEPMAGCLRGLSATMFVHPL